MPKPPKALLERAVKAAQLYCGSEGARIQHQQRFYTRMDRAITAVAAKAGIDRQDANDQIIREARRRGCVIPRPGKDY